MQKSEKKYIEILGDTVHPIHVTVSIILCATFSLTGFLAGKRLFPAIADEKMVLSYSLLLGIGSGLAATLIAALLFRPKRFLIESTASPEEIEAILHDMQIDPSEEADMIQKDAVTRKEMEELGISHIFVGKGDRSS